uniref:carbamoyl-phosphate synthase arginine-specific small subunit n=1 Tax=Chroothece richteriana TaxID=101928 RepID=UPI001FCDA7D3|nr:carbamoyl-phosphate synthase arginine-specific small subunit [Chroothece richteriana]UNJ14153.1 carbamoyl-phosphate synthase arginine-specific small subunit [Chroothece richteriana]
MKTNPHPAVLVLEDGIYFKGWSSPSAYTVTGEVVFTTGMTGYQEIIMDPSYAGQIIIFTSPEIGNTGTNDEDNESFQSNCAGIITRNFCYSPTNWRMKKNLSSFLDEQKVPFIYGIDTRILTQHIRTVGAINGCMSNEVLDTQILLKKLKETPSMKGLDLVKQVTSSKNYSWTSTIDSAWDFYSTNKSSKASEKLIVVLDCGVKYNILRYLATYGFKIKVLSATSSATDILAHKPDGILLSNGPGDPSAVTYLKQTLQSIFQKRIPTFGICMGHQIISLALGGETFKLKFGHRGINHPTGIFQKIEITSQNHGFAVNGESFDDPNIQITHYNLNDFTVAGLAHKTLPIFSVQYHPEASPGPHDAKVFFDIFHKMVVAQTH